METKVISIDGQEIEVAIKLPDEYFEKNDINNNFDNTLQYNVDDFNGDKNE